MALKSAEIALKIRHNALKVINLPPVPKVKPGQVDVKGKKGARSQSRVGTSMGGRKSVINEGGESSSRAPSVVSGKDSSMSVQSRSGSVAGGQIKTAHRRRGRKAVALPMGDLTEIGEDEDDEDEEGVISSRSRP